MHIHTTKSDGILTPSQIVEWAIKLELKGISITDHDTVDGIEEAIKKSYDTKKLHIIPGIEFSTLYKEKEVHILGYFIDYKNKELLDITERIKLYRTNRAREMVNKLKKFNIYIEDILNLDNEEISFGRPHIARALMKKGYVKSMQGAFEKYLIKGKPGYVPRFKLSVEESIKIIKEANGIPVLAHPGLLDKALNINEICEMGIEGMEVYHTKHSDNETKHFLDMAKKMNFFITGGTDFHDQFIDGVPTIGSIGVSFESIKEYIK